MKKIFIFIAFAIFAEFVPSFVFGQSDKTLLDGFLEKQLPFTRARICYPENWYITHNNLEKEKKYFVSFSRENPYSSPAVKTALSIVTFTETSKKFGKLPSEYAKEFIAKVKQKTNIIKEWKKEKDDISEYGFIREDSATDKREEIKEYFIAYCNDNTGTIYMLSFISPLQNWEQDWEVGKTMIESFQIDKTF